MRRIVYMHHQGSGTYRPLRSDTLWGMLCWLFRYLQDDPAEEMAALMDQYKGTDQPPFVISSAFPWRDFNGQREHYFPTPHQAPVAVDAPDHSLPIKAIKQAARGYKKQQNRKGYVRWQDLRLGTDLYQNSRNVVDMRPMTHNLVDRRRLGTLTMNGSGQLFHTEEQYLKWKPSERPTDQGLFFIVDGDYQYLEPALRLAEHWGLAGDRSIGKGHFRFSVAPFDLPAVEGPNASLLLSLFRPHTAEMDIWLDDELSGHPLFNYRLMERAGRKTKDSKLERKKRLFFTEGSVFPKGTFERTHPGDLFEDGRHWMGHPIYRNGYASFIDIKLPTV